MGKIRSEATRDLVVIGSSTGGPEALERIIGAFSPRTPGMIVVQHMPRGYTRTLAERLNALAQVEVREARLGDVLERGLCLIAPAGRHLKVQRLQGRDTIHLVNGPRVHGCIPAVDVTLKSIAAQAPGRAEGAILTGMGRDGADGCVEMHQSGNIMIAQDQDSSVVFGMPKEAIATGKVQRVAPLGKIPELLMRWDGAWSPGP